MKRLGKTINPNHDLEQIIQTTWDGKQPLTIVEILWEDAVSVGGSDWATPEEATDQTQTHGTTLLCRANSKFCSLRSCGPSLVSHLTFLEHHHLRILGITPCRQKSEGIACIRLDTFFQMV